MLGVTESHEPNCGRKNVNNGVIVDVFKKKIYFEHKDYQTA